MTTESRAVSEPGEPGESHKERVDRELQELLQGLRVAVTGVQVLFAFLLTVPFQQGFTKIDQAGLWLFFIALLASALASVCFITPAAQHRLIFRTGLKERMIHRANRLGIAGAIFLLIAMTSAVALVAEVVLNNWPAAIFGGIVALTGTWFWLLEPIVDLRRER
ncbi:DUF6328 family protein [Nonomuraea soli]|uniref:Sodium:proton antiporter n=1 Tax=Nonomuraea soli TaxID=1032476 RepID=A0A7W0CMF5_9ACTN|nr:DUF6328 family protein [Nonomuraea soli]MBA2893853.1 hypothetical protein [Nonomuraea soli]